MNRFYVDPSLIIGEKDKEKYEWICALSTSLEKNVTRDDVIQETIRIRRNSPFHSEVNGPTVAQFVYRGQALAVTNAIRKIRFRPVGISTTQTYRALVSARLEGIRQFLPVTQLVRLNPQYQEVLVRAASFRDSWQAHRTALMFLHRVPARTVYWRPLATPRRRAT